MIVVDKVDTVEVGGISRRRLTIGYVSLAWDEEQKQLADIWVEGIGGATISPCLFHWWASSASGRMESCIQDGEVLFSWDDFFSPGITSTIAPASASLTEERSHALYDLEGRRLSARPEKGLYIEGGKKRLVR